MATLDLRNANGSSLSLRGFLVVGPQGLPGANGRDGANGAQGLPGPAGPAITVAAGDIVVTDNNDGTASVTTATGLIDNNDGTATIAG